MMAQTRLVVTTNSTYVEMMAVSVLHHLADSHTQQLVIMWLLLLLLLMNE